MPATKKSKKTAKPKMTRKDRYAKVLAQVTDLMDDAKGFWTKPWISIPPHNATTGRPYRGINSVVLWFLSSMRGASSNGWLTYKQAVSIGGNVKKGEKGVTVMFWQRLMVDDKDENGTLTGEKKPIFHQKLYTVFHVDQCEGLKENRIKTPAIHRMISENATPAERLENAILFCDSVGADYTEHNGDRACYNFVKDTVALPSRSLFTNDAAYIATRFHELGHWTGHETRLDRGDFSAFGTEKYAREELVAEFVSAILCSMLGVEGNGLQHPEYLAHWRERCSDDPGVIVNAGQRAQKAVDHLIEQAEKNGFQFEPEPEEIEEVEEKVAA